MNTIGDRITQLLRDRGRQDRGEPYNQIELVNMLTGKVQAPNGKSYNVQTNPSTISKILTDKQQPPLEILLPICEIFETDAEWILRGNTLESVEQPFMTDEANKIGAMIDEIDEDTRKFILTNITHIHALNKERKARQIEIANLMQEYLDLMPQTERKRAESILSKIAAVNRVINR